MDEKIAVLIPVYNDLNGLLLTLGSLLGANVDFKVWIVDDSDTPLSVISSSYDYPIEVLRPKIRRGIEGALNHGLEQILKEDHSLIARIDAGDIMLKTRLSKQLELFRSNSNLGLVGTHVQFRGVDGEELYKWRPPVETRLLRRFFHLQNPFVHSSVMYSSDAIRQVGFYSFVYPAAEDFDLFLRLSTKFDIAMIDEVLMICELNPSGISVLQRRRQWGSIMRLKIRTFDPLLKESYTGILRGLFSGLLPFWVANKIKSKYWGT